MPKKSIFLFFCMIFVAAAAFGQVVSPTDSSGSTSNDFFPRSFSSPAIRITALKVIPASFYTDNFGFFCDKEWKLEKATKVPLKLRLGTVQQVDYLEGKPNAVNPAY